MLSAQVEYWKLQENKRHNLANEGWQNASLDETRRHNLQVEQYNFDVLSENKRHNLVTEDLGVRDLNIKTEQLNEMVRSNRANEQIGWANSFNQAQQARASLSQAKTAKTNAQTREREASISAFKAGNEATRIEMEREMLPFNKFQSVASGIGGIFKGATSLLSII